MAAQGWTPRRRRALLCASAALAAQASEAAPTFALLTPTWEHGVCCQTEFFDRTLDALRRHPGYRTDPAEAEILIPMIDTLRQCEWPTFEQGELDGLPYPGCSPGNFSKEKAYDASQVEGGNYICDWCCPYGVDEFVATVQQATSRYGLDKTFVFFRNSQDNFHECSEFKFAKVAFAKLPATVRFAGFQLQSSHLTRKENSEDSTHYPMKGINMLTPLHPLHEKMVLGDAKRSVCNLAGRDLRASFVGHVDPDGLRNKVFDLKGQPGTEKFHIYSTGGFHLGDAEMDYEEMLGRSVFAYVPRGDEHYSFRLTEVLAAGAVPVLIDDDFVAPAGLPDISKWALRVSENDVPSSVDMINSLSDEDICHLMKVGTEAWQAAKNVDTMVDALVKGVYKSIPKRGGGVSPLDGATPARRAKDHLGKKNHTRKHASHAKKRALVPSSPPQVDDDQIAVPYIGRLPRWSLLPMGAAAGVAALAALACALLPRRARCSSFEAVRAAEIAAPLQ